MYIVFPLPLLSLVNHKQPSPRAKSVTRHPKYIRNSQDYDYAIIKLSEPVTFNNNVYPVCLPSGTEHSNKDSIATGWGTLKAGGRTPDILQKVSVRSIQNFIDLYIYFFCYAQIVDLSMTQK